ncbi:MAG TPA: carbohydrate binding domain-containing protein [Cyclobacteriaceae bacterium]|nr:carbohydrate binding domain-containing protein [Cyclobacteriaceae bacterium]HRJ83757.1 carbohydrate binding domain-containing protein [Cyclobacteriaceae bacterium]
MKIFTMYAKLMVAVSMIVFLAGCKGEDELLPQVNADFTYTLNEDTGTVTFINTSTNATKFVWDFGDGETSTEINPVKTYPSGSYTVRLTASNVSGASDFIEDNVVIDIKLVISLPITFDNSSVNYTPTVFNGASFAIVDNPSQSGTNNKATKVGAITNSGVAFEGLFFDLGSDIDLAADKRISLNFRSTAATTVLLKLEEGTAGAIELTSNHGGTGWEILNFDFNSSAKYSRLTLFVDGPGTTAGTFYIDDIKQEPVTGGGSGCTGTPIAAPSLPVDFEGCATFLSSENFGAGITSELTANPSKTGINTSNYVLKVDKPTGSDFYAGIQNTFASNFNLTTTNTFKVKVYSTKANVVFRFELAVNPQTVPVTGNPAPVFRTITTANVWTEVAFTFTGLPGGPTAYNQLVIKPDNTETDSPITAGGTYYLDDLTLSAGGATSPATAAPTPPARAASDVVSIFSNAYTNITGVDYNPNWGQATVVTTIDIAGNATLKYAGLNYQGTDFSGNAQNVSSMQFLHVDFWTANSTALNVSVISPGPSEKAKALTVPTNGNWTSIDIPLSDFSPPVNLAEVFQLKFDGNGDIYLDNIYFYKTGPAPTAPTTAAPTPPARAASDVISIFSNAYTNITGVDYNPNWGQATVVTTIDVAGNATLKYAGLNYQGTDFSGNAQNVSGMQFLHVDFWTANSTALNVSVISPGPSEKAKALTVPTNGNWTSVDIPLSDFSPPVNLADIIQLKFDGNGDIYLDNIYFYKSSGGGTPGANLVTNGDFETGDATGWNLFQNGGSATLDNTTNNGGTWSGKLATGGPSNPAFKQERIGAGVVKAGDVVRIRFDHKGSVVQPGAVFNVLLFGEGSGGASFTHVFNPAPVLGSNWTTFTGNFTIAPGTDVSEGISFLIEAVCGGDAGCSVTANIDNVSVVLNP